MESRSGFLSRFFVKFLEVAGAGLASAVCAYCLGQIGRPAPDATAAAPVAAMTSPATEDAIRLARDDHALLVELGLPCLIGGAASSAAMSFWGSQQ